MTIKVGDWVWFNDVGVAEQVIETNGSCVETKTYIDHPSLVSKLTPYASMFEVKKGKAVVVVDRAPFSAGMIVEIKPPWGVLVSIEGFCGLWPYNCFAPIPCADAEKDEAPVKQKPTPTPPPCPHPEREGIWDYCGDGYRVEWEGDRFVAKSVNEYKSTVDPWEPGEFWKHLEPAPDRSIAYPPQRHWIDGSKAHRDHLLTPWDPDNEG
jgi:hypothetical protein